MALSASSVASLDFCGVIAMSVVASLIRWTIVTARRHGPRHERGNSRIKCAKVAPIPFTLRISSYRLGNAKETDVV